MFWCEIWTKKASLHIAKVVRFCPYRLGGTKKAFLYKICQLELSTFYKIVTLSTQDRLLQKDWPTQKQSTNSCRCDIFRVEEYLESSRKSELNRIQKQQQVVALLASQNSSKRCFTGKNALSNFSEGKFSFPPYICRNRCLWLLCVGALASLGQRVQFFVYFLPQHPWWCPTFVRQPNYFYLWNTK